MDFLLFFIVLCIVQRASLNCPFFENGHFAFRGGESTFQFNYRAARYRAREKLNLNAHFPHITGQSVFLESGQFSVHLCTMHKIDQKHTFYNVL